jgi:hypothetical protein
MRRTVVFLSIMTQGCGHSEDAIGEPGLDAGGSTLASGDGPALPTTGTGSEPTGDPPVTTTTTSSSSEGSGESSASTEPGPVCGDGIVEGDEGCDDGFSNNLPGNPCTDGCQPAACGDGSVQASNQEACDHGVFNVDMPGYEQCSTSCTRGPYCGDGVVQADAGEECEPGGREDEVKNCAGMCRHKPRILFITSTRHTGDLGGLAGADQICNKFAAQQDGLTGTYRAWLLVDGQSLADRFPEFMAPVAWNFTNTAAGLLAKDFAALVAMGPKQPIAFTEAGEPLAEEVGMDRDHGGWGRRGRRLRAVDQRGRCSGAGRTQRPRAERRAGGAEVAGRTAVDGLGCQADLPSTVPLLLPSGRRLIGVPSPCDRDPEF